MFSSLPSEHRAALLDPDCYEYVYGTSWARIVPDGTTWYAVNLWYVQINGLGPYFHRRLDIRHALPLTPGTIIGAVSNRGFAYICKPELLVTENAADTCAVRFARLLSLPTDAIMAKIPIGSPLGKHVGAVFPSGFEAGMIRHVSSFDVCWTVIVGNQAATLPGGTYDILNTHEEISDNHTIRFTGNINCPFKRMQFHGIWAQAGSRSGDYNQPSEAGTSIVTYSKLPSDW